MVQDKISVDTNFIRIAVSKNDKYSKWKVQPLSDGIRTVCGFNKGNGFEVNSILFSKDNYDVKDAKQWTNGHGYTIYETCLVSDIVFVNSDEIIFIEEIYHDELNSNVKSDIKSDMNKYNWLFDKRTNADIFYGE